MKLELKTRRQKAYCFLLVTTTIIYILYKDEDHPLICLDGVKAEHSSGDCKVAGSNPLRIFSVFDRR